MKDSPAVSVNSDWQEIFCFTGNYFLWLTVTGESVSMNR